MTRWLITPSTVRANLRWLWRFQLERRIRRPVCCSCSAPGADVYFWRAWWCRRHPLMIPGRAVGIRPHLRRYTKRQAERPPPQSSEEIRAQLADAIQEWRF
jgi:glutathione S-transferase